MPGTNDSLIKLSVTEFCYQLVDDNMWILQQIALSGAKRETNNLLDEYALSLRQLIHANEKYYENIYAFCQQHFAEIVAFLKQFFYHQFATEAEVDFVEQLQGYIKGSVANYDLRKVNELASQEPDMIAAFTNSAVTQSMFLFQLFLREMRDHFKLSQPVSFWQRIRNSMVNGLKQVLNKLFGFLMRKPLETTEKGENDWWEATSMKADTGVSKRLREHDHLLNRLYLFPARSRGENYTGVIVQYTATKPDQQNEVDLSKREKTNTVEPPPAKTAAPKPPHDVYSSVMGATIFKVSHPSFRPKADLRDEGLAAPHRVGMTV